MSRRDHIVVGFITTYAISAITTNVVSLIPAQVLKFVSDLQQVSGFLRYSGLISSTNKTDLHNIAEILLKMALNTITLTPNPILLFNKMNCELMLTYDTPALQKIVPW